MAHKAQQQINAAPHQQIQPQRAPVTQAQAQQPSTQLSNTATNTLMRQSGLPPSMVMGSGIGSATNLIEQLKKTAGE
jgi:hypothetical protein